MTGLRRDGVREIRARYPNGDPEFNWIDERTGALRVHDGRAGLINFTATGPTQWLPSGGPGMNGVPGPWPPAAAAQTFVITGADWPGVDWPASIVSDATGEPVPDAWPGEGDWGGFWLGINGSCADRAPPAGYWCHPGAPRKISVPGHPAGMVLARRQLPNFPYRNASGAVVHAWGKGHWYTNIYEIGQPVDAANASRGSYFARGGTQGNEGLADASQEWFIEGVVEELDAGREWHFDRATRVLFYKPNATAPGALAAGAPGSAGEGTPTPTGDFVATTSVTELLRVQGTQAAPARHIAITGLTLRDTAPTYFAPHGLPSGGDWALAKTGAITLVGTEGVEVRDCLLTRLDGNGIFIGGYARNLTLSDNDFELLGGSAMCAWGDTSGALNQNGSLPVLPWKIGPDGRGGDQPRGCQVIGNVVREIGIWQKQSSAWFQAVTAQTTLLGNVIFNGPRAGLNFNDGFGGGDDVSHNLIVNMVRESGDHGPINSWDRVPYITTLRNGSASIVPADRHVHHNFVLGTYNSQEAIDNDDGSAYYRTYENFLAYAANGLKSDFGGHDNRWSNNVLAYAGLCFGTPNPFGYFKGYNNAFGGNRCVGMGLNGLAVYNSDCKLDASWNITANEVFTADGNATVCGQAWADWFAPAPAPVVYNASGAAVPCAASTDFVFAGGAVAAHSRDDPAGADVRSGSPHGVSTALLAHPVDSCEHELERVSVAFQYIVGYDPHPTAATTTPPNVTLLLINPRNQSDVVAVLWRSAPLDLQYSYDKFAGYSPPIAGGATGLSGLGARGRCAAVALRFANNDHNVQVKLATLNVSVGWRAAAGPRAGRAGNCSCSGPKHTRDAGSKLARWPSDSTLVGWGKELMGKS